MDTTLALDESQPGLSQDLAQAVRAEQLSSRTVRTYQHWITQYLTYNDLKNPRYLSEKNVRDFLVYLMKRLSLSRAKLNQAREALVFLYEKVLRKPIAVASLNP
ncbi:MAG: integrase [Oleiphilus sp.]|nr:MAG: integrase [Oleiphilus sp.]